MIDPALKTKVFMARARMQALSQVRMDVSIRVSSTELDEAVAFLGQKIYKAALEQQAAEEELQTEIVRAQQLQQMAAQMAAKGDAKGEGLRLVKDEE